MIKGIKLWNESTIRYEQKKNAIEAIIRKTRKEDGVNKGYLESCGASAFCTIMEGMGYLKAENYFAFPNGATIQMDDAVMCYLNDPKNDHLFQSGDRMDNRYYASYVTLAKLYNVKAIKSDGNFDMWAANLTAGNGVQAVLKEPGHYIALIAYDAEDDTIIFHDSWETRNSGKPVLLNRGRREKLHRSDMDNMKDVSIIYIKE